MRRRPLSNLLIQSASNSRSATSIAPDFSAVVRFASSQPKTDRQPTGIDDCMYLGRQAASRPAHQLLTTASDASSVLVHAHNGRINHLHGHIILWGQRIHELTRQPRASERSYCSRWCTAKVPEGCATAHPNAGAYRRGSEVLYIYRFRPLNARDPVGI